MPNTYKILGRLASAAATNEVLYTVPSSTQAVVSTVIVANRSANPQQYRMVVLPAAGTTIAVEHYIAYDVSIAGNDSLALTLGITLDTGNTIRCYTTNANTLTFTAFGSEIS
jgi:hypothetical protein